MLPALALLARVLSSDLGPNPLALLLHTTGRSALVLLTATLAITPLRRWLTNLSAYTHQRYGKRLSDWNWLIRLRPWLERRELFRFQRQPLARGVAATLGGAR